MTGAPPPLLRLPASFRLVSYDRLGSTNDEAKRLAREEDAAHGTVVWALEQTQGHGRTGRIWASPPGNLYCSTILRPDCPVSRAAEIGFVAALAVGDALAPLLRDASRLGYKWPNDVLIGGRKVSGILAEAQSRAIAGNDGAGDGSGAGTLDWLVVGVGVNVASHPPDARWPATDLAEENGAAADAAVTVPMLLEQLIGHLARWLRRWQEEGFAIVRTAWLERAAGLGAPMTARLGAVEIPGRFADLDADGALLLDTGREIRRIAAGEVFPTITTTA
jgi:BirA family transcriptional regulator, biotin operon repressor / biotin---[acetyl-CoA-carboxylase] ligase